MVLFQTECLVNGNSLECAGLAALWPEAKLSRAKLSRAKLHELSWSSARMRLIIIADQSGARPSDSMELSFSLLRS